MGDMLNVDSSGVEVTSMPNALQAAGLSPGAIYGMFGLGTEAAVLAFQQFQQLRFKASR
jgi:peptidoglycan hydrolase-like protein with peptidoglycan-binding domain